MSRSIERQIRRAQKKKLEIFERDIQEIEKALVREMETIIMLPLHGLLAEWEDIMRTGYSGADFNQISRRMENHFDYFKKLFSRPLTDRKSSASVNTSNPVDV